MLLELKVQNFAIIENLHLSFRQGLNILSGETGAGKSVLLRSLSLLMGAKSSSESIRTGSTQASIEGSFDLSHRKDILSRLQDMGIEVDENLLVVRRVLSEEKSRIYLNGTLSTLNNLRDLVSPLIEVTGHSAPLIEMTGQHDNRNLLSTAYHLDLLDQYVGAWELRSRFAKEFQRLNQIRSEIEELKNENQTKAQRLDFLIFQRNEIKSLSLNAEKDQDLEIEIKKLKSSSRLGAFVDGAENALYNDDDSAMARLNAIIKKSFDFSSVDPTLAQKLEPLEQAKSLIEDAMYELRSYISKIETDPQRLEQLEQRLSDLRKVQKKYGPDIAVILEKLSEMETEIAQLENSDLRISELEAQSTAIEKELEKWATELHKKRHSGSKLLADSVNSELLDLNMKGVTFHVAIEKRDSLCSTGISEVEFKTQTSPKDAPRSLGKVASGGELSRILLSLKRVVGATHQPRTYLFDEVDTGVSGPTAEKVGRKLKSIAQGQQVICVTHLPQVAACGDAHFFIQKSPGKEGVAMEVLDLKAKDRVKEIARLISGEKISKTSLAHAEQLLSESAPH